MIIETVVEAPFDETWDGLVQRLSEGSLRISTFDKASHFLVIEAALSSGEPHRSDRPSRYADCGRLEWSFTDGDRTEAFAYEVAEASRHLEGGAEEGGREVLDVSRAVNLSVRATLHLRPEGAEQTRMTVNSRYTLSVETTRTARGATLDARYTQEGQRPLKSSREEASFRTFTRARLVSASEHEEGSRRAMVSSGSIPSGREDSPVCGATGELERELIALAASIS